MEVLARRGKCFNCDGLIDPDWRESVEVEAKDLVTSNKIRCFDSVLDTHGEIISYAERGEFEFGRLPNQLHIHRQCGVPGIVEIPLTTLDDEASRIAAVRPVGQAAGMNCIDKFDPSEIE